MKKLMLIVALLLTIGYIAAPTNAGYNIACGFSLGPCANTFIQGNTLTNSTTTGGAASAVTVTLTGATGTRVHIYRVSAFCSAGTSTLTIADGASTIYTTSTGAVGTAEYIVTNNTGLTMTTGNNGVVTLGTCGPGNSGTVNVQADRF